MPTSLQKLIPLVTRVRWCASGLQGNDTWQYLALPDYKAVSYPLSYLIFTHPERVGREDRTVNSKGLN